MGGITIQKIFDSVAGAASVKIAAGGPNKQTEIEKLLITASATCTGVTISDGNKSFTIFVSQGMNDWCFATNFHPGADVTLSPVAGNASIFAEFNYK